MSMSKMQPLTDEEIKDYIYSIDNENTYSQSNSMHLIPILFEHFMMNLEMIKNSYNRKDISQQEVIQQLEGYAKMCQANIALIKEDILLLHTANE